MAFVHGKGGSFTIQDSAGTVRDLSPYLTKVELPQDVDAAETTTFGATGKTYILGLRNGIISLEGRFDATAVGWLNGIVAVDARAFTWGPAGTTTGFVKYSGSGFLTNLSQNGDLGDVVGLSAGYQISGAPTVGVY